MRKYFKFLLVISLATLFVLVCQFEEIYPNNLPVFNRLFAIDQPPIEALTTRDFIRYKCNEVVRIGGNPEFIRNTNDNLWRIDGAYFICLDNYLKPEINNCTVLSFGINNDYSFDIDIRNRYGCKIESFDPFIEADFFKHKRKTNKSLIDSYVIPMDEKWNFNRIGIIGDIKKRKYKNKIGWMTTLEEILKITNLVNKTIDIIKMDIEGEEALIIYNFDIDYACQYFKQFVLETHPQKLGRSPFQILRKLEKCFSLFHRDTRFFKGDTYGLTGHMTEFQNPKNFKLDLKDFKNEIDLANYLFCYGELYFVNRNFIV